MDDNFCKDSHYKGRTALVLSYPYDRNIHARQAAFLLEMSWGQMFSWINWDYVFLCCITESYWQNLTEVRGSRKIAWHS